MTKLLILAYLHPHINSINNQPLENSDPLDFSPLDTLTAKRVKAKGPLLDEKVANLKHTQLRKANFSEKKLKEKRNN